MRKQKLRQLLAVLLTLCLLLGCVPAVFAADQTKELELQQTPVSISPENENVETDAADEPAPEETVRVIIRFRSDSLTEHGYSTRGLGSNAAALAYSDRLQKKQRTQIKAISAELGVTLPVRYQFTIGVNGVATSVPYGEVEAIRAMDGVESVYVENQYEPDVDEPNTATAGTMIGSYNAWADGYTGAGSRVAIIDTGLDIDHPSFDESAFLYGLERSAARFGKQVVTLANDILARKVAPKLPEELTGSKAGAILDKVVAGASAVLAGTGMLTLAEESRPMAGGLILRDNNVETNCSFEVLIHLQRDALAAEVAKTLFD